MYLTGFADEAADGIDQQIAATKELGWQYIESRNIDGQNLHDISDEQFDQVCQKLADAGVKINCFGSAIANSSTPIRICAACQAQDNFEDHRLAREKGKVFSFTHDNLAPSIDPPSSVVLIDFEGGGRAFFDLTDRDPEAVGIGTEVEMTFRKVHFDRGIATYFWKARPIRINQ